LVTQDLILDWYHVLDGFGIKLLFIYNQKLKDSRVESFFMTSSMAATSERWIDRLQFSSLFWPPPQDVQQKKVSF